MEENLSMWDLEYIDNTLFWKKVSLYEISSCYGTPAYVFSKSALMKTFNGFVKAFQNEGIAPKVFYSVKTNPVPKLLKILYEEGCGAEIISEYELWLAEQIGFDCDKIILNGSVHRKEFLKKAIEKKIGLINVDNLEQLLILNQITNEIKQKVNIGIRINPSFKGFMVNFTLSSSRKKCHIGFDPDSKEFIKVLNIIIENPFLNFKGIHFHLGSGIQSSKPYDYAFKKIRAILKNTMIPMGLKPKVIDIGGGFAIPTVKTMDFFGAISLFGFDKSMKPRKIGNQENLLSMIAGKLANILSDLYRDIGIEELEIYIEPGRAISGPAQILLLSVVSVVEKDNKKIAICDAGSLSLSPILLSEDRFIFPIKRQSRNNNKFKYQLVGNMPAQFDIVALNREFAELHAGDILAVMDVGAYFTSMGNNFSGPRPLIVLLDNKMHSLLRKRETFQDLIARDIDFNGRNI